MGFKWSIEGKTLPPVANYYVRYFFLKQGIDASQRSNKTIFEENYILVSCEGLSIVVIIGYGEIKVTCYARTLYSIERLFESMSLKVQGKYIVHCSGGCSQIDFVCYSQI